MTSNPDVFERLGAALADRYALEEVAGKGGMATVYRATDIRHGRQVALKVLDPGLAAAVGPERFLNEIETVARLTHPHILPLHDSGEVDGFLFYVMPFVKGESLRDLLDREKQLPVADAIRYTREIADALAYAHAEGVIHRDVKPANILLEAGHAVLADFGVAHAMAGGAESRMTGTGVSLGSPAYMSPEQISGERELDARSDQYALGCILYEMLAGHAPFSGPTASQVLARQLSGRPPRISTVRSSVDPRIDDILALALQPIPADRFASVKEMSTTLGDGPATPAESVAKGRSRAPEPARAQAKNRISLRWVVSTASLAILVLAGGLLFLGSTNDFGFQRRDWILLTDFQNSTGEAVFDRSLDNALAVGLQQSNHLNVFPKTRISQTLQRMLREDTGEVGEELGREVALRENLQLLVVPSIDRIDQTYVVAIRIVDPASGADLLSRSNQAEGPNDVLPSLDRLARQLRHDLGESRFSISRQSVPLGAATTPSLEALQAWSEGAWHWGRRDYDEGMVLLRRAVELDSAFAMAHADLGGAYYLEADREKGELHTQKALSLRDRATERERLWISAEIETYKGNYEAAIGGYNIYLTRFPDDLDGWFRLGYAQMRERRSTEAIAAFDTVVSMDPENAAAYINLATSHSFLNHQEEAVEHYLKAFEIAPDWLTSSNLNHEFGMNYVEFGDFEAAEAVFREMLTESDGQKGLGHRSLSLMKMYLGQYAEARDHLREASFLHRTTGEDLSEMRDRLYLAAALFAADSVEAATEELETVRELATTGEVAPSWLAKIGKLQLRYGLVAETQSLLEDAVARSDETISNDPAAVALLRGEVALATGETQAAIDFLRTGHTLAEDPYYLESLAFGLFQSGDLEGAATLFREFLSETRVGWEVQEFWVLSHYHLGQILEQMGNIPSALDSYRALADLWREGDEDLLLLQEVRTRIAELTAGS